MSCIYIKKTPLNSSVPEQSESCIVEIIGLCCFGWQLMLLCAARQTDSAVWHGPSAQPGSGSLKFLCSLLCIIDSAVLLPLDYEWVVTRGCVPVVGVGVFWSATGLKWWDKGRKSPPIVGESLNSSQPVRALIISPPSRGPTGAAVMDRYILWGITGMKKGENNQKGSPSSIIFFSSHRDYSHLGLKGKPTLLINHDHSAQIQLCISLD